MELEKLTSCLLCNGAEIEIIDREKNISRCGDCGYIFDNPRPAFKEIQNYYSLNDKYDDWLKEEPERARLWKRRLKIVKQYVSSGKLLDVGTGIGQFLSIASESFDVSGTEISESAVKIAKERYNLDIHTGAIENLDINSGFNLITLYHVLEHVPDPSETINICRKLLITGGVLIIAVPNDTIGIRPFVVRILRFLKIGKFKNYGKLGLPELTLNGSLNEIHLSHFKSDVLAKFLKNRDFEIIDNTLDPYYAEKGLKLFIHYIIYIKSLVFLKIFNKNIYPTILITARKTNN